MEWTIFPRQSNFFQDFYGCIVGINILFFLWVRMGLLWFLLGGGGGWGQGQQRVVLIMFMVVGQQRKKSYFLLDLNLANFKRYSSDDGKHVLYEREFMFKTVCSLRI